MKKVEDMIREKYIDIINGNISKKFISEIYEEGFNAGVADTLLKLLNFYKKECIDFCFLSPLGWEDTVAHVIVNNVLKNIFIISWRMKKMNNSIYEELIGIINDLCDIIIDLPCGCEICPYNEEIDSCTGDCQAQKLIQNNKNFESEWVPVNPNVDTYTCRECDYNIQSIELATPFCPECGRRMTNYNNG